MEQQEAREPEDPEVIEDFQGTVSAGSGNVTSTFAGTADKVIVADRMDGDMTIGADGSITVDGKPMAP